MNDFFPKTKHYIPSPQLYVALSRMNQIDLIQYVPYDLQDDDLYAPLPSDHYSAGLAMRTLDTIADEIERVVGTEEPYEIAVVALKMTEPTHQPVILVGMARPDRLEEVLPTLHLGFKVHVRQSYPASFANNVDRNPRPKPTLEQQDVPPVGTSCGVVANDRHTVSVGGYVALSAHPKKICVLTVPPTYKVPKGTIISQPSIADRGQQYLTQDWMCREVLEADPNQAAALRARRQQLETTFHFGIVLDASTSPSSSKHHPAPSAIASSIPTGAVTPHPSNVWVLAELTRTTAFEALSARKPRALPFRNTTPTPIRRLETGIIVSKQGRTTGRTIGTVNGIKALYRLPHDGPGVRRLDYVVLSHPWGGAFAYPGDAGAILMAHEREDIEDNTITQPGKPCGMVVAASTSGHLTFVESLEDVNTSIFNQGHGTVTFLEVPR